uniref:DNA-binding protein n=1 Tax=Angiostrongylus cantonensis TaxID=6313 RepID=A0A0K0D3V3_ANGCA
LPIMGSLVNWWSPIERDGRVRGRFFNLNTGEIQTTDVVYKNKNESIATSHGANKKVTVMNGEKESKISSTTAEEVPKPPVEQPTSLDEK